MANDNNASTMMVALIAILVILAIGFIVLRVLPAADDGADTVNIETPDLETGIAD